MRRTTVATALAAAALVLAAGCSSGTRGRRARARPPAPKRPRARRPHAQLPPAKGSVQVVRTLTQDLKSPWGSWPLPEGGLLVGSRDDGSVRAAWTRRPTAPRPPWAACPASPTRARGACSGSPCRPTYASDHLVYAYFTTESDNRIARMIYDPKRPAGEQLGAPDTILRGIPKGAIHNGGRIAFGPDRMLYAGTGETGERGLAQDAKSLGGKILRMTPDGGPAYGNPDADSVVYSYGHRNVQGLAWDGAEPAVGLGVRAGHLGRAQPHRTGQELRLARGGGPGRASPDTPTRSSSGRPPRPRPAASPSRGRLGVACRAQGRTPVARPVGRHQAARRAPRPS